MTNCIKWLSHKWILLTLIIIVILAGLAISNRRATARPQEDATIVLSIEDEPSGISYLIGVDNQANEVIGRIDYDDTATGIAKYQEFNNKELAGILQDIDAIDTIPVKITFNAPLGQTAFTEFVEQYQIDAKNYTIYMLEPDGKIATIQGSPSDTELVPGEYFNMTTTSISQEYNGGAELVGWVEVDGTVRVNRISEMKADQRIYMIDIMQLFLESRLTDEALATAGVAKSVRQELLRAGFTDIYRAPVAWNLYHLGLMQRESSH